MGMSRVSTEFPPIVQNHGWVEMPSIAKKRRRISTGRDDEQVSVCRKSPVITSLDFRRVLFYRRDLIFSSGVRVHAEYSKLTHTSNITANRRRRSEISMILRCQRPTTAKGGRALYRSRSRHFHIHHAPMSAQSPSRDRMSQII